MKTEEIVNKKNTEVVNTLTDLEFYQQLLKEEDIRYKAGKCVNKQRLQSLKGIISSLKKEAKYSG